MRTLLKHDNFAAVQAVAEVRAGGRQLRPRVAFHF